jgi:hypothetical protein
METFMITLLNRKKIILNPLFKTGDVVYGEENYVIWVWFSNHVSNA